MNAQTQRTPGPLSIEYDNDTGANDDSFHEWWTLRDADGNAVCQCDSEAQAESLRAKLNAHDELVAALRKIQDDMAGFIKLANEVGINDADGFYLGAAMDAEKQARAALAKVTL